MKNEKSFLKIGKWCVIGLVLLCIIWGFQEEPISLYGVDMTQEPFDKGWVQIVDGASVALETVDDFSAVAAGETLVLETVLPELRGGEVFTFCTKHQEVRLYLDDILVYDFLIQDAFQSLQTPGNEWNEIFLDETMSGATLRVELTSQFSYYSNLLYNFYLIHESQMLSLQLEWLWLRAAVGVFLAVIAVLSYLNGGLWYGTSTRKYVLLMGDFYLVIALWAFANAGSFDVVFRRPIISYLLEMIFLRLMPIMAYLFVRNMLSRRYFLVECMGVITYLNFALSMILQFVFGVSFLSTIWVTHAILVMGSLVNFYMIANHLYQTRAVKEERNYLFICTGMLFASALAEVFRFYVMPQEDLLISIFIAVGYVIYTIIAHVALVYRSAGLDRGKTVLETNYNKLQNTTLMRQINAHFFFNTLNTISAMCKTDAEKADEGISLLAKYMRHYMYFINTNKNISFANELDLIRVYLAIEQMRFEDSFSVEMDIAFSSFQLPPLTIEPIVENAIMHGLRQQAQFGTIQITSKKVRDCAVITVQDNGVGFDVALLNEKESLAIDNIRTRLTTMVNGRFEIESEPGVGTLATVYVPL